MSPSSVRAVELCLGTGDVPARAYGWRTDQCVGDIMMAVMNALIGKK